MGNIIVLALTAWWLVLMAARIARRGRKPSCTLGFLGAYEGAKLAGSDAQNSANAAMVWQMLQAQAAQRAYEKTMKPYGSFGADTLASLNQLQGPGGYEALMNSPAVQMRLNTGQQAIDRSAAASGGLFSGNTGKALMQYGQDLGSEEYGNEFNRRSSLANMGMNLTQNMALARAGNYNQIGQIGAQGLYGMGQANVNKDQQLGAIERNTYDGVMDWFKTFYGGGKGAANNMGNRNPYGTH